MASVTWSDFVTQLRADRRKAAILVLLSLVFVALAGRLVFSGSASPSPANASDAVANSPTAPAAAPAATATPPSPPIAHPPAPCEAVDVTAMSRVLSRDLFATDWNAFPPTSESLARRDRRAAASAPTELRSSLRDLAAALMRQFETWQNINDRTEREAAQLRLQATFLADPPRAVIDGRVFAVGDLIGGYRVIAISGREVTLLKSGLRVRLTMP